MLSFNFIGCASFLCTKGDSNQGLYFDYDPVFKTVDIAAYPTFHLKDSWVKKLIVKEEGFLLVYGQNTVHCDNREEMRKNINLACKGHKIVENYTIIRYTDKTGYEEWSYALKKDWESINSLGHIFLKKADYHYKNCRYQLFAGIKRLLQIIKRI